MAQEYKLNRLETTATIGPMVDRHWEELRTAKQRGEKVGWCSGPMFIFPYAMGMKCHFMAGYAAYCGGRRAADQVLEVSEAQGDLPDTCSYHKLHMGMAEAVKRGIPIKEDVILPIPDLMIIGRLCTEMAHYAEGLYRRMDIPVCAIDCPPPRRKEDYAEIAKFVETQVREELIPTLERICGYPFKPDKMTEILSVLKKAATLRNECWEYFKKIPSPWTLWDYGVSIAPVFYLMGKPETIPYYEKLKAELADRAEKGIAAIVPEERYRIYWDGWLPWAFLGPFSRKFTSNGAVPLVGRYPWEFFPHPEAIDLDADPIHNYIQLWYNPEIAPKHSPELSIPFIGECIEKYSLDGMIMFTSKSCRIWSMAHPDMVNIIEKKYGVPGVIIDADMVDSKMVSEAQINTRMQALFETIDARRGVAKRR